MRMLMLSLLRIPSSLFLFETVTKSITVKARSKNSSVEAAAQQILGRAALVATESPPENWIEWFADVRYEYVPQGDRRLQDRRIEARPTCVLAPDARTVGKQSQ